MKITNQIPNYKIKGLSQKANTKFWTKESIIFKRYLKFLNVFTLFCCLLFNLQLFFISYNINVYAYALIISIHVLSTSFCIQRAFHLFYTLNYFFLITLKFFSKKFNHISNQIRKLGIRKPIDNRKLRKLIYDFNYVYLELMKLNEFFKLSFGIHFIHYFLLVVIGVFAILKLDIRFQIPAAFVLFFLYIFIIYTSFTWSQNVLVLMEKTNHHLNNVSFNRRVSFGNKKKISFIPIFDQHPLFGFTCYDFFKLTSNIALVVSAIDYLLILIFENIN